MIVALFVAILSTSLQASQPAPPAGQSSSPEETRRQLNLVATGALALPSADLRALIESGLQNPDEDVQLSALWAIVGSVVTSGPLDTQDKRDRWARDRPALQSLRELVRSKVTSPAASIRRTALMAMVALDVDLVSQTYAPATISLLVARYAVEHDPGVRSEIVKQLAFARKAHAGEATIVRALDDADEYVVFFAIMGVEMHGLATQLPKLVTLLDHPSLNVRMSAAGVIGTFRADALPYLAQLKLALAREQEPEVRATMQGAITSIVGKER